MEEQRLPEIDARTLPAKGRTTTCNFSCRVFGGRIFLIAEGFAFEDVMCDDGRYGIEIGALSRTALLVEGAHLQSIVDGIRQVAETQGITIL